MPNTTLDRIQKQIAASPSISPKERESLIALISELQAEVEGLPDSESARAVTAYAEISVQEATQPETDQGLLDHAVEGLKRSTNQFRTNHPRLTSLLDDMAVTLSGLG